MMFRFIAVSLVIGALSACSSGLTEKAEGMKPGDNKFLSSLHAEYIALAKAENDEGDFLDADHHPRQLRLAAGQPWDRMALKVANFRPVPLQH